MMMMMMCLRTAFFFNDMRWWLLLFLLLPHKYAYHRHGIHLTGEVSKAYGQRENMKNNRTPLRRRTNWLSEKFDFSPSFCSLLACSPLSHIHEIFTRDDCIPRALFYPLTIRIRNVSYVLSSQSHLLHSTQILLLPLYDYTITPTQNNRNLFIQI